MRLVWLLAWRSVRARPGRSFTAALGVAVGIATVLSVQVLDHNTLRTQERRRLDQIGQPDVVIRPVVSGVPEDGALPAELVGEPDLVAVCGLYFQRVAIESAARREPSRRGEVQLCGIGPLAAETFGTYRVRRGRDFSGPDAAEVLLSERLAEKLGVDTGDVLTLRHTTPVRRGCREGRIVALDEPTEPGAPQDYEVVGLLAPLRMGAREMLVVPFEAGLMLLRDAPVQPEYWGRLADGAVFQDVRERLKGGWLVEKPRRSLVGERIDQRAFRKSVRVTSILALLLGLFVIYHAFAMALVERIREIGLLRAIGLRRAELAAVVLAEGGMLAGAGAAGGLALTAAVVWVMQWLGITTLGYGKPLEIREVPLGVAAGVVGLGVLFALLGVVAPLARARRLSVVESLRVGPQAMGGQASLTLRLAVLVGTPLVLPLFFVVATPPLGERQREVLGIVVQMALLVAVAFLVFLLCPRLLTRLTAWLTAAFAPGCPAESTLTRASIRGSQQRVVASLTGLTVVVAALFCIRAVTQGFLEEYDRFSQRAVGGRLFLHSRPLPREQLAALRGEAGIERVVCLSAEVMSPFAVRGVRVEDLGARLEELAPGTKLAGDFARGEAIVLSEFLAASFGYQVGDTVTVPSPTGPRTLRVGCIDDRVGYWPDDRSFALVEAGWLESVFCVTDETGTRFVVDLEAGADRAAARAAVTAAVVPDQRIELRSDRQIRRQYLEDRRRDFWVFQVILALTICLAGAGVLNSLAVAVLERRRELSLLRTLGLTRRQVGRMLLLESLATGLLAGVLATALTLPLSALALTAVRVVSRLDLRLAPGPLDLLLPVAAALGIALVAALGPARRAGRLDLGSLARYE